MAGELGALTSMWLQGADGMHPSVTETHMPGPSISTSALASPKPTPASGEGPPCLSLVG